LQQSLAFLYVRQDLLVRPVDRHDLVQFRMFTDVLLVGHLVFDDIGVSQKIFDFLKSFFDTLEITEHCSQSSQGSPKNNGEF
jgi:hypothetical protein